MSARSGVSAAKRSAGGNGNGAARPVALTVRPASRSDLVPLNFFVDTVLRRDYFLRRGQLEDLVTGRYHQVYVAELDTVLVGIAVTTRGSRLINALVHPAYRGLGIGKALIDESGATEVRAKLDMSTGDPRGFYRRLGFVSTGVHNDKGNIEVLQLSRGGSGHARMKRTRTGTTTRPKRNGKNGVAAAKRKSRK